MEKKEENLGHKGDVWSCVTDDAFMVIGYSDWKKRIIIIQLLHFRIPCETQDALKSSKLCIYFTCYYVNIKWSSKWYYDAQYLLVWTHGPPQYQKSNSHDSNILRLRLVNRRYTDGAALDQDLLVDVTKISRVLEDRTISRDRPQMGTQTTNKIISLLDFAKIP